MLEYGLIRSRGFCAFFFLNVPPSFWGYLLQCIFDSIRKWFSRKKQPNKCPGFTCNEKHIEKRREISFEWGSLGGSYKSQTVNNNKSAAACPATADALLSQYSAPGAKQKH
jgi:hypothetical protein